MLKEKFISNLFRVLTILTPILMIIKSIVDKAYKNIGVEITLLVIYAMICIFIGGVILGFRLKNQDNPSPPPKDNSKPYTQDNSAPSS